MRLFLLAVPLALAGCPAAVDDDGGRPDSDPDGTDAPIGTDSEVDTDPAVDTDPGGGTDAPDETDDTDAVDTDAADSDAADSDTDAPDADHDGVPDDLDACRGVDATGDADGDGACADVDPCPLDPGDDAAGNGRCDDVDLCEVARAVVVLPADPGHGQALVAALPPVPSGAPALALAWSVDGADSGLRDATVPAGTTSDGEVWTLTATGAFPWGGGCAADHAVLVRDHAPAAPDAVVLTAGTADGTLRAADARAVITCRVPTTPADPEGDAVAVQVELTVGGSTVAAASGAVGRWTAGELVDDVALREGTTFGCRARASAGALASGWTAAAPLVVGNTAPTVTAVQVADVGTGESFVCGVAFDDPDADRIDLAYAWEAQVDGVGPWTAVAADGPALPASAVGRTDLVRCTVTVSDEAASASATSDPALVLDALPVVSGVELVASTDPPLADAVLTCTPSGWSDDDGDPEAYVFAWTVDGVAVSGDDAADGLSSTLAGAFRGGQQVACSVTPWDGYREGVGVSDAIGVVDLRPVCAAASVSPASPGPGAALACGCDALTDLDGDATLGCAFVDQAGRVLGDDCTLPAGVTVAGQRVTCTATPTDPHGDGAGASATVDVGGNARPVGPALSATLDTAAARASATLTCADAQYAATAPSQVASAADPDGVFLAWRFRWTVGGVEVRTDVTVGGATDTVVVGDLYAAADLLTAGAIDRPTRGDVVGCTLDLWDGRDGSDTRSDATTTLANGAPVVRLAYAPATGVEAYDPVDVVVTVTDEDGGPADVALSCFLFHSCGPNCSSGNGRWVIDTLRTVDVDRDAGAVATFPFVADPVIDGSPTLNAVTCLVGATDDVGAASAWVSAKLFFSSASPKVGALALSGDASACSRHTCTAHVTDADTNAGGTASAEVELAWIVDGVVVASEVQATGAFGTSGADLTIDADDLALQAGAALGCTARVRADDAHGWSASTSTATVAVAGAPPTVADVVVDGPPARVGETLACVAGEVTLGCAASTTLDVTWTADGVPLAAHGETLDTSSLAPGTVVACAAAARADGGGLGPATASDGGVTLEPSTWTILGDEPGARAGYAVAVADDLDGDGTAELVIGAPNAAPDGLTSAGKVYVIEAPAAVTGSTSLGEVGEGTDGVVIAGESGAWNTTTSFCSVLSCAAPAAAGDFVSPSNGPIGDGFGTRVAAPGDVDGDGRGDLVVSAPYALATGGFRSGRVYVVSGPWVGIATPEDVARGDLDQAGFALDGEDGIDLDAVRAGLDGESGDLLGWGLSWGDFDGDGLIDLAAGSPQYGGAASDYPVGSTAWKDAGGDVGRVHVVDGGVWSGAVWAKQLALGLADVPGWTMNGRVLASGFSSYWGGDMARVPDWDGDGDDEVYAGFLGFGAYGFTMPGGAAQADVDLTTANVPAGTIATVPANFQAVYPADTPLDAVVSGKLAMFAFPSGAGDVNGDGIGDLIRPWWEKEGATKQLEVALFFGKPGLASFDADGPDRGVGGYVVEGLPAEGWARNVIDAAPVGDVDGDGLDDWAFWTNPAISGTQLTTRIYVVFGKADGATIRVSDLEAGVGGFTLSPTSNLVYDGLTAGDVDGDGFSDIVYGEVAANDYAGRVDVWFGRDLRGRVDGRGASTDDVLTGTDADDRLIGGAGDDVLLGGGGADVLYGGSGDDALHVGDAGFARVRGGRGVDTLVLGDGVDLDLADVRGLLQDVEAIDGSDGAHVVALGAVDVLRLSTASNDLVVLGGADDTLEITGGDWTRTGAETWRGHAVDVFASGHARLLVEQGMGTQIPPVFTATAFTVDENPADGTAIGVVDVVDADGVVQSLALTDGAEDVFGFDPVTGALTVRDGARLDHERQASWTLSIRAIDDDGLATAGTITVTVADVPEPPTFVLRTPVGTVEEGALDGTVAATVGAVDQDAGDEVVIAITSGDDDGAFAVDPVTGRVTVVAGWLLDHELETGRTLHLVATDTTGLSDEVDLDVTIDDVTTFEEVATYTFSTVQRDLWRDEDTWDVALGGGGHGYGGTRSRSLGLGPILNASIETTASGTMDWDATLEVSTGAVNASLPVEVTVVFPDSVRLGEPFTLTTAYALQDDAAMWGTSPSVSLHAAYALDDFAFTSRVSASSALAGRSGADEVTVGPYTLPRSTIDFEAVGTTFTSARFDALYPDGVDLASSDHAVGWMADALDLGGSGTFDEPDLLVTSPFEVSMYSGYYDWDNWLAEVLPAWAGKNVGKIPLDLGAYDLTLKYELLNAYLQLWLGLEQGFYLRIAGIDAHLVFEDGSTATVSLGDPLTLTLPADADVDADGRVDVTATFSIDARLTNSSEPYWRYDSYTRVMSSTATLTDYSWSEYHQRYTTSTLATWAIDPVAAFGWTFEHAFDGHVATGSALPSDATRIDVDLDDPLAEPVTFRLEGFNEPTMRGGIQVAP